MSSIQIGGTYVNYVSIGARGNVSLDCSGNSLFRGDVFVDGSFNISNINSANTISNFNLATNQTTGNINIATGLTTGTCNISTTATGNAPIIIGSTASTTQTLDINAITTFSKIPSTNVVPTTSNHLCNKTYVDSAIGSSLLSSNNTWTGTNAFNTSLPTSTVTPSGSTELTTKAYVDSVIGASLLSSNNTWTGTNAFNTSLPTSTITPSTSTQLTTKTYVDSNFCSLTGTQTLSGIKTFSGNNTYSGTSSFGSTVSINTTGGATTSIGNTSASIPTVELFGNVQINTGATNVRNTSIGNATGITTVTGQFTCTGNTQFGDAAADFIVPNGTMTKPWIIGTYASQSSFSLSSITPVTTYLGGTIETSATYGNVPSGSFKYLMVSIAPYNSSGGIALTAGTYMFWIGINFEDASAYNLTDLRLGMSTSSTLTAASTEATIIASLPNLTCYFHKTDAADAASSDAEQRVLSGCFNITSATTLYPFYGANHAAVTMDTISSDVVIVKIGGP